MQQEEPARQPSSKNRRRTSASSAASERRPPAPLILFVDDNGELRDLYAAYFVLEGFRVGTASDGATGFIQAVESQPDVVVADLSMPHVDGWEMTRRLKRNPRTAHIPVIACTGRAYGGSAERALDAGCDAYVVKPYFPEDMIAEVRRQLAHRATRRRSA